MTFRRLAVLWLVLLWMGAAGAQTPSPSVPPPQAIPLSEIVLRLSTASSELADLETKLNEDPLGPLEGNLSTFARELEQRLGEARRILTTHPSLEALRQLTDDGEAAQQTLIGWKKALTERAAWLDGQGHALEELARPWTPTLTLAHTSAVPAELIQRIGQLLEEADRLHQRVKSHRSRVLILQDRLTVQEALVADALAAVAQERSETVNRIWLRDSPPIWSSDVRSREDDLRRELQDSVTLQWRETTAYCSSHAPRFVLHLLLIALLAVALRWAGFWLRPYTRKEPELRRTALIFRVPLATAVALSIGASHWIYPFAPPLLVALLGAVALVPTRIILRRLIDRQLLPILDMLVVFYFIDLLRTLFAPLLLLTRLLFLAEMLAGAIMMGWLLRKVGDVRSPALKRWLATLGGLAFTLACLAAALGYVALGNLLGNTALQAAYLGVVIYSASHIANGLILLGVHMPPFGLLGSIKGNRELIRLRVTRLVALSASLLWLAGVLQLLSLRQTVIGSGVSALGLGVQVGALHITLGDVLAFPLVLWLAIQLSRFMRFVLEEDIYPRVTLPRGVPYALSTMLHYCLLTVGFIVALTAAGIDTSRFTLVVGALGVGIGLGLQNIVQNLVSGLILLFERPFQVGDCITFREFEGDVTSIGLRATILKTTTGADVIVPNGMLVSSEVINWTLVGRQTRRMDLDVPVPHDIDIPRVVALLNRVCAASTFVASRPSPRTIISEIRETSIVLQVQVWMADASNTSGTKNDIYRRVEAAFVTAKIKSPTTDVRLRLDSLGTDLKDFLREWPRR